MFEGQTIRLSRRKKKISRQAFCEFKDIEKRKKTLKLISRSLTGCCGGGGDDEDDTTSNKTKFVYMLQVRSPIRPDPIRSGLQLLDKTVFH